MAADDSRKWRVTFKRILAALIITVGLVAVLDVLFPPPLDKAHLISRVVLDRNGAPLRAYPLDNGTWRIRADLDRIDPAFVEALLAYERQTFLRSLGRRLRLR